MLRATEDVRSRNRRRAVPAWMMSALFHALALLALSFLIGSVRPPPAQPEDRPVSVVLTSTTSNETTYLTETDWEPSESVEASPDSEQWQDRLPSVRELDKATPDELALPTASEDMAVPTDGIVQEVGLPTLAGIPNSRGGDMEAIRAEQDALRRAKQAKGPVGRIQLFHGAPALGRSFVFLIDRSKSMGSQGLGALAAAEKELVRVLHALQPTHQFQVVAYHNQCTYLHTRELLLANDENKRRVVGFLENLAAMGATEHERAILSTLRLKPDALFLLTDGGEPALTEAQQRRITKLAAPNTTIHCVQFGFGPLQDPHNFLQHLAERNGGSYRYVDMSADDR